MREFTINEGDAGQTLIKYLGRLLKDAPQSFFYKMLRKKNITLNGKKACGNEIIRFGDVIKIFVSEDTFAKFSHITHTQLSSVGEYTLDIVYEDDNILLINKPVGMLSQKAKESDISANEYCIDYLIKANKYNPDKLGSFKPAVCNRLDRNTTGILIVAITAIGAVCINSVLKYRTIKKYYVCPVKGIIEEDTLLTGCLCKDGSLNKVTINSEGPGTNIETYIRPIKNNGKYTLLEVELLTGKSHQIRAHLASIGHPLLGDNKYGDCVLNKKLGLKYQLLQSYKLIMPNFENELGYLSNKVFEIKINEEILRIMEE